jgi:hypothetical protein
MAEFEWNHHKARSNVVKHGISFEEALTVFEDPLARIFDDEEHSIVERREIIIGHSCKGRLLLACFTAQGDHVRIISARKTTNMEKQDYEENCG